MLSPAGVEGGGVRNVFDSMQCEAAEHVKRYEGLTSRCNGNIALLLPPGACGKVQKI
jgi:hypothetical protein